MSVYIHKEKIVFGENGDNKKELVANIVSRINKGGEPPTVSLVDHEKRMRREIANSNERRRMQSINNGFQSLRSLLPHHEGEKLSKAAILQQTAEYIYSLEQEKTRLLSQNCQLKRLVSQHEGGELPPKKRLKTEIVESLDETLSTETVKLITLTVNNNNSTTKESPNELKSALDRERNLRLYLEDQVHQLEQQLFQTQQGSPTQVQFLSEDNEDSEDISGLQLVTADSLPPVGHTQTVVCSPPTSRCSSPEPAVTTITVEQRLPSVLEAAIKAEPKVEVERLPTPNNSTANDVQDDMASGRIFAISNTSRQNLETIVEAIRHLEGDHMFGDEPTIGASVTVTTSPSTQDTPLALTKRTIDAADSCIEYSAATVQKHQQSRPGVIVVKQAS